MESILLTIKDEAEVLNPTELAEFLYLFQGANVALGQVVPSGQHHKREEPTAVQIKEAKLRIARFSPKQLDSVFDSKKAKDLLHIGRISRESPLEIVVIGCFSLLTLAVIFSGGKIEISLKGIKAQLPSLGHGVKSLREALGLNKPLSVGFGIREVKVKLNKAEYKELTVQTTGTGGFQSFFRGLQNRVNKSTKELTLSPEDLERIYRHKVHPEKGGWQSRLKKLFGRHFPDDQGG